MTPADRLLPLVCQRFGCPHAYTVHAPGGAHCRAPGCGCVGFQFVPLRRDEQPAQP